MRFVVTGGGTGGHIYPALAIARGLRQRFPGSEILYIGGDRGLECEIASREGIPFQAVRVRGLQRKLAISNLAVLWYAFSSIATARRILKRFGPAAVIGTGGYVCGPVVLAAFLLGIPTMIHEQNAMPGFTNRVLSRFVKTVAVTFEESVKHFSRRTVVKVTGLPVREDFIHVSRDESRDKLGLLKDEVLILSFGGSQGAKTINEAMVSVFKTLRNREKVRIWHVTGTSGYNDFIGIIKNNGLVLSEEGNITIKPYLHEMPVVMASSDLVIARAGASTVAEITVVGVPAILIPYPYAAADHQYFNALALSNKGAALVLNEKKLSGEVLAKSVEGLISDKESLGRMAKASKKAGRPQALSEILDVVQDMLQNKLAGKSGL